jgi:hypothetical protein
MGEFGTPVRKAGVVRRFLLFYSVKTLFYREARSLSVNEPEHYVNH